MPRWRRRTRSGTPTSAEPDHLDLDPPDRSPYRLTPKFTLDLQAELDDIEREKGRDHPDALRVRGNLAGLYEAWSFADPDGGSGQAHRRATVLREENLTHIERVLGPDHNDTVRARGALASAYLRANRVSEAARLLERALAGHESHFGPDDRDTLSIRHKTAEAHKALGKRDRALELLEQTVEGSKRTLRAGNEDREKWAVELLDAYTDVGRFADSIALCTELLAYYEHFYGPDHIETFWVADYRGYLHHRSNEPDLAVHWYRRAHTGLEAVLGSGHAETVSQAQDLAAACVDAGQTAAALEVLEGALPAAEQTLGTDHPQTVALREQLSALRAGRIRSMPTRLTSVSQIATLSGHTAEISDVTLAVLPDGSPLLATGGRDRTARIWDCRTGALLHTLPTAAHGNARVTLPAPGPALLATTGTEHRGTARGTEFWDTVRIWDGRTGGLLRTLVEHTAMVESLAWAVLPDRQLRLAVNGVAGNVEIWDGDAGTLLCTLTGHTSPVYGLAWGVHPNGRILLASSSSDHTVRIWDARMGKELYTLTRPVNSEIASMAWAARPDGRLLLAIGSEDPDGTVKIWDGLTARRLHVLTQHSAGISAIAWATLPNGRLLLATGSEDRTVRIWDAHTFTPLHTLATRHGVISLAYAPLPDGRLLLATAEANDHSAYLHEVLLTT